MAATARKLKPTIIGLNRKVEAACFRFCDRTAVVLGGVDVASDVRCQIGDLAALRLVALVQHRAKRAAGASALFDGEANEQRGLPVLDVKCAHADHTSSVNR